MTTAERLLLGLMVIGGPIVLIWMVVVSFRKEEGDSRFSAIGRGFWAIIVAIIIASLFVLIHRLSC